MKVVVDKEGSILEISKTCRVEDAAGESLGIEKMGREYTKALYAELEPMMNEEHLENKFYDLSFTVIRFYRVIYRIIYRLILYDELTTHMHLPEFVALFLNITPCLEQICHNTST